MQQFFKDLRIIESRFTRWLERNGIDTYTVDECTLQRFLQDYKRKRKVRSGDAAALARFRELLRQTQVTPNPQAVPVSACTSCGTHTLLR